MIYNTKQGDTFDSIAKTVYGNERRMDRLIEANSGQGATVIFPAGVVLQIPEIEESERRQEALPPWR